MEADGGTIQPFIVGVQRRWNHLAWKNHGGRAAIPNPYWILENHFVSQPLGRSLRVSVGADVSATLIHVVREALRLEEEEEDSPSPMLKGSTVQE